jgi:regulator of sigma E protease
MFISIIAFIIVLGVLIFFHELGHFIVARLFGVGVEKFSLGFGPKLLGKKIGITDYRISAIPLGGYVKMVGEEPDAEVDPAEIPISFTHKNVFQRILIVAAGPLFNFLLAIVIFFGMFQTSGMYVLNASVGKVEAGSPASRGGLEKGDLIVAIDDNPVNTWDDMASIISQSQGKSLSLSVRRGEEPVSITITPELKQTKNIFGEDLDRYMIGIAASGDGFTRALNPFQAMAESILQTYRISELTILSIVKLIQGVLPAKTLGGPIMIAQMAGQQAKEGAANLIFLIAVISINLGILNFLPIPVLDGGHLCFFFIEAVKGKPVNTRMREIAQQAGIFVLILLMILVFYNDITR